MSANLSVSLSNLLNANCLPCGHNSGKCFVFYKNNKLIHITSYDATVATDSHNSQRYPVPALALLYLSYYMPNLVMADLEITNSTFSILVQAYIPFEPINILARSNLPIGCRFSYCTSVDQMLKYYVQAYCMYILFLKFFPCANEIDVNVKDWNFVLDQSNNLYLLDGLSINLATAIIYSVKQKLDVHRELDIVADTTNTKFAKSLRTTRRKHLLQCVDPDSSLNHLWIDNLRNVPSPKILSKVFLEYRNRVLKLSPLALSKIDRNASRLKQVPTCTDMGTDGPCCFRFPNMVSATGHALLCKSKFHTALDVVKSGLELFAAGTGGYILCSHIIQSLNEHTYCVHCLKNKVR